MSLCYSRQLYFVLVCLIRLEVGGGGRRSAAPHIQTNSKSPSPALLLLQIRECVALKGNQGRSHGLPCMPNAAAGPTERHAAAGSIIGIKQMRKPQRAPVAGITQLGVVELRSTLGLTLNFILEVLIFFFSCRPLCLAWGQKGSLCVSATFKDLARGVARVYRSRLFVLSLPSFQSGLDLFCSQSPISDGLAWDHVTAPCHGCHLNTTRLLSGMLRQAFPIWDPFRLVGTVSKNSPHGLMASQPFSPSADSWEKNRKRLGWTPDTWGWYGTWWDSSDSHPLLDPQRLLQRLWRLCQTTLSWNGAGALLPHSLSVSIIQPSSGRHSHCLGSFPQLVGPVSTCDAVVSAWHYSGGLRGLHHIFPSLRSHANLVTEGCGSRLKGMAFGRKRQNAVNEAGGRFKIFPQNISYIPQCTHLILTVT